MAVFSGNGSNTAPSFTFSSDTNTGIYRVGENQLGFATDGTLGLVVDSSQRVAIGGITSASGALDVRGSTNYQQIHLGQDNTASSAQRVGIFHRNYANTGSFEMLTAADPAGTSAQLFIGGLTNPPNITVFSASSTYGGAPVEVGRWVHDQFQIGPTSATPASITTTSGYTSNSSRLTAPQIGASDYDNFDTQTATSSLQYAVVTKSFSYSDTTTYLDVVKLGRRGSYKITVAGDDASAAFAAFHFSESILCVSDTRAQNVAPDVKFNRGGDGLDVQWKASGSTSNITTQPEYVTLQVKPQSAASNQFTVTVQVFSRYALSTATVEFNP